MLVVGTAGHVDHGKSTLIQALTGIDPDRLRQEKERGLTIELGFAWLTLPSGVEVSIVDVPGHERFIKNMLMGVGGIDVALLIVAADEAVMPQTREHLAILDLLQIRRGIVVITKRDLVEAEWLELVISEVTELLEGTTLESAPIVPVSAVTSDGLEDLMQRIDEMLTNMPETKDLGRPRLPVDRSFTMSGFGTVVTGTLTDGVLRTGQEIAILPRGRRARIRGLQTHGNAESQAQPGTRVAVNLSGISYEAIRRGDVITTPGWLRPTDALDVSLRVIRDSPRSVKHNLAVTFFTGSSEAQGRVRLLDSKELKPEATGWAQIKLEEPVAVVKGDYFVARDTETTLAGGRIVDPYAPRHRRFDPPTLGRLKTLAEGSEEDVLQSALESIEPAGPSELAKKANLSEGSVEEQLRWLVQEGRAILLSGGSGKLYYSAKGWAELSRTARQILERFHAQWPLRLGVPKEELRNRLRLSTSAFARALDRWETEGVLASDDALARLPGHEPQFSREQQAQIEAYLRSLSSDPYSPPTDQAIDPELVAALADQRQVVRTNEDVVFLASAYDEMVTRVVEHAKEHGEVAISDVRAMFGTSRKYTLSLLEHMDRQQITRRVGDNRVLR